MSSVIIDGLKLPKYNEKMFKGDPMSYICYLYVNSDGTADLQIKSKDYPVKNVPVPHGRLVDQEKVMSAYDEFYQKWISKNSRVTQTDVDGLFHALVSNDTIIEAEGLHDKT